MTDTIEQGTAGTNWAGNYAYRAREVRTPTSVEELRAIVRDAPTIRVLGSRHSFNDIADSEVLVSLAELPADLVIDRDASTATFSAGLPYGKLAELLGEEGLAIHNLASLPHISVGGAIATATHGSGIGNGNLGTAVAALEMITADGETVTYRRGGHARDPRRRARLPRAPARVRGPVVGRVRREPRGRLRRRVQRQRLHALRRGHRPGVAEEPRAARRRRPARWPTTSGRPPPPRSATRSSASTR
ncbi:FAD-binding protein [Clavibacter michiganensis]|uniref:FAD-binding protein n=1 Tax=Clavibacter michiganensis TaxID=28447 RepID=UPI0023B83EC2|nr:FAD-binding protein [Clavibacter michiganensis]